MENNKYLTEQIITYIGNKRSLLNEIEEELLCIQKETKKDKFVTLDLFSGSGVVARLLKTFSSKVIANDLENYSYVINSCYLDNYKNFDAHMFNDLLNKINKKIISNPIEGIITKNYAPHDDNNIDINDRVFYTRENAILIDSYRYYIENIVPTKMQKYFYARLLYEASVHTNTAGVFKGFYKDRNTGIGKFGGTGENALLRIKGKINISEPVFCNTYSEYEVYKEDANNLVKKLNHVDIAYLDPPYNQHPYGSNYFMLNLILDNKLPKTISKVSGIPDNWNHSTYNKKTTALNSMSDLIKNLNADYIIISYNNEGFISFNEMVSLLNNYGTVKTKEIVYNTYRGSRNLRARNIHTSEYLFILKKGDSNVRKCTKRKSRVA